MVALAKEETQGPSRSRKGPESWVLPATTAAAPTATTVAPACAAWAGATRAAATLFAVAGLIHGERASTERRAIE